MKTYKEMYKEAITNTINDDDQCFYDGYNGVSAISYYVYTVYNVNAMDSNAVNDALADAISEYEESHNIELKK